MHHFHDRGKIIPFLAAEIMPETVIAELENPQHADAVMSLLDGYAVDLMGGGTPLSDFTKQNLINELKKRVDCVVVLCFVDSDAVAMAICFEGFSTFACRPVLNIHDVTVAPTHRQQGLSRLILEKVESVARQRNCCKLTLEVLQGNKVAQNAYIKAGFCAYELNPEMGSALFWEKKLS